MRFSKSLAGLSALSAMALATNPPSFFLLKTQLIAPQTGPGKLNNLYMGLDPTFDYTYDPIFTPEKEGASFFSLAKTDAPEYDGHAYYALKYNFTKKIAPHANIQALKGSIRGDAYWTSVNFVYDGHDLHGTNLTDLQKGFWLDSNLNLQWTNNFTHPSKGNFGGWLVCDWWYGVPELFMAIGPYYDNRDNIPLSSNCARTNVSAIPI